MTTSSLNSLKLLKLHFTRANRKTKIELILIYGFINSQHLIENNHSGTNYMSNCFNIESYILLAKAITFHIENSSKCRCTMQQRNIQRVFTQFSLHMP